MAAGLCRPPLGSFAGEAKAHQGTARSCAACPAWGAPGRAEAAWLREGCWAASQHTSSHSAESQRPEQARKLPPAGSWQETGDSFKLSGVPV